MNSLQIALCDDNSLSRQLAQLAIQEYERQHPDRPCRVHAFSSGTALLSFLDVHKDFSFDLFILDVMMPTLDGIQIGKELRARGQPRPHRLPVSKPGFRDSRLRSARLFLPAQAD